MDILGFDPLFLLYVPTLFFLVGPKLYVQSTINSKGTEWSLIYFLIYAYLNILAQLQILVISLYNHTSLNIQSLKANSKFKVLVLVEKPEFVIWTVKISFG